MINVREEWGYDGNGRKMMTLVGRVKKNSLMFMFCLDRVGIFPFSDEKDIAPGIKKNGHMFCTS